MIFTDNKGHHTLGDMLWGQASFVSSAQDVCWRDTMQDDAHEAD